MQNTYRHQVSRVATYIVKLEASRTHKVLKFAMGGYAYAMTR